MKTTAEIIRILGDFKDHQAERYGISRLGVFGSVARQEQTEGSDVDIFYEGDPHGLVELSRLKIELESILGCPIDIVRMRDRMNLILRERIEREGVYV